MNKELQFIDFPEEVTINPKKIESEKEEVKMKNPTKAPDISQGGGAFHEKKGIKIRRLILVVLLKENHLKQSLLT